MQKNIRQGVFETNSSSMHVIVIDQENVKYKEALHLSTAWNDDYTKEKYIMYLRSYGWGFDWLDYTEAKLSYLMTYAIQGLYDSTQEQLNESLDKIWTGELSGFGPEYNDLIDLADFIKEYSANSKDVDGIEVRFQYDDQFPYIDHQSYVGNIESMLRYHGHGMSMAEFVFNPAVRMRISNDNEEDEELEEALRNARYNVSED